MLALSKRWIRQIAKIILALAIFSVLVLCTDFYLNFLPTRVHTRLPSFIHQPGNVVLDLKVVQCLTEMGCSKEEKDGWERIPEDLYLGKSWTKAYVYSKRIKEEGLQDDSTVVLDAALSSRVSKEVPEYVVNTIVKQKGLTPSEITVEKAQELGWVKRGDQGFPSLWIKTGKYNTRSSVTAVDILFGKDAVDPRPGWNLREGSIDPRVTNGLNPRISIRIGPKKDEATTSPKLKVGKTGSYKVMQVADLHYSTGVGTCMDPNPEPGPGEICESDPKTLAFLKRALDKETPDMVVLTGDQIFGSTAPHVPTAILKAVAPFIEREIPYAMVFGNHDDESDFSKAEIMELISRLPFSVSEPGPDGIDGVGNYALQVNGPRSDHPALTFYFLDSHKHLIKLPGYDYIKQSQLDFISSEYDERLHPLQKEYSHIHLSMAFFHIPLPEYTKRGSNKYIGSFKEGSTAPKYNSGVRNKLSELGVTAVSVGHDHVNDFCMYDEGEDQKGTPIWLCHGGGIGEGGYGGYGGYIRRCRILEFDTQSGSINTWKLKNERDLQPFDVQTLVSGGQAISPEP